jgi:hypothetical protein
MSSRIVSACLEARKKPAQFANDLSVSLAMLLQFGNEKAHD